MKHTLLPPTLLYCAEANWASLADKVAIEPVTRPLGVPDDPLSIKIKHADVLSIRVKHVVEDMLRDTLI